MDFFAVIKLLGGLGLFLFGMKIMSEGLEAAAGEKLRNGLELMTKNRFLAMGLGAGVTAVIQSSSATTVMVVGFVNAGLMTLMQAINVGIGANIGTTVTAQIVAFKITKLAPLVLFVGVLLMIFVKKRSVRRVGEIIGGLGILLFGMEIMSEAVSPLKDYAPFIEALSSFQNPWVGVLVGAGVTAIIQSSSATMGIVQAFAMQGVMGLDNGVYIVLGLNIGTCITAILASISGTRTSKRFAVALLFFNVIGSLIFMLLMQFLPIVDWVQSWSPGDPVRQLANFHTFFNCVTAAIFICIPFVLSKLAYFFVRGEDKQLEGKRLKYITKDLDAPPIVLGQAVLEVERMIKISAENFQLSIESYVDNDEKKVKQVLENEKVVNYLNHEITDVLARLSQDALSEGDAHIVTALLHAVMDIERISDIAENISDIAQVGIDGKVKISPVAKVDIEKLSRKVCDGFDALMDAIRDHDVESAAKVAVIENEVDVMEKEIKSQHVNRVRRGECTAKSSTLFTDVVTMCERVADHAANVAKMIQSREIH